MTEIFRMTYEDVDEVWKIEEESFSVPWTKEDFQREMKENKMAVYFVARIGEETVGYAGMWHVINEGHITNVAVSKRFRGQGIGRLLMDALFKEGIEKEMIGITLEVGENNTVAQNLYTGLGFKEEGRRNEDALIMWKYF